MEGWIKIHKKIQEWEWYGDSKMVHLFLHLLISASYRDSKWRGNDIKRGQAIVGLHSLSEKTGISVRSLRTCLSRLEVGGEIVKKTTNKFTIVTICNYEKYQVEDIRERQSNDNQTTIKRQHLRSKEVKKTNIDPKSEWKTDPTFQQFWQKYPRKVGGAKAYQVWEKKKCGNGIFETVMGGLQKAIDGPWVNKEKDFIPHPTTWLNQERWDDEHEGTEAESVWE